MENNIENTLREYFANQKNARLSFLMGSYAKGTARKESDVDVAVLFDVSPDIVQVTSLRGILYSCLKKRWTSSFSTLPGPLSECRP